MSSFEQKIASAVLGTIRTRRRELEESPSIDSSTVPTAKLREATFSDFDGVMDLRRSAGWGTYSVANWRRVWLANPALALADTPRAIGWVLEANNRIVGYLGNVSRAYHYGERPLTAVVGSGLVAEPAYRAIAVSLNAAFYRQKGIDLYLTTTAIEAVGRISAAFKSLPLPQPDYDSVLFWVLQPKRFAEAMVRKLQVAPRYSGVVGTLASLAVKADRSLRTRRPPKSRKCSIVEIGVDQINDDFLHLWATKLQEGTRLFADRDPATLRWHFENPDETEAARVLCCYNGGTLTGYAIVRHEPANPESGLRRSMVVDMLVLRDDATVAEALWIGAYDQAKARGSHTFELLGFPRALRQVCVAWRPYVRKYPACPFYYKASAPDLLASLTDRDAWYACPFDGDTTLWGLGGYS